MGKEINAILGAQTILIWTYVYESVTLLSRIKITVKDNKGRLFETQRRHTGPQSAVGNVSDCRYVSDCRSRGREFDPSPVPYFLGD